MRRRLTPRWERDLSAQRCFKPTNPFFLLSTFKECSLPSHCHDAHSALQLEFFSNFHYTVLNYCIRHELRCNLLAEVLGFLTEANLLEDYLGSRVIPM
ncbi:hypothetical protein CDAR_77061 [Caerostris darwini]|uniref:Uncharacterized protein n=1 Tax=Caerostris darwini TaxID=1538125 RepID=A0AAV4R9S7_9ARAC|nr:hypothetical protein CDAR_77061 [Caerostris darwini]